MNNLPKSVLQAGQIDIFPNDVVGLKSAGRLLIIGIWPDVQAVLHYLEPMDYQVACLDQVCDSGPDPSRCIQDQLVSVQGWIGRFEARFTRLTICVDLVLDMSVLPLINAKVLPLGYFAPRGNDLALREALQQLPELVGIFDKPKYFSYHATLCAHSRSQLNGCNRCLQACPAEAISSAGDIVSINPCLCQGCGSCVSVCPSGAIEYALPELQISLNRLRAMLQAWFAHATAAPHVLIHDLDKGKLKFDAIARDLPSHVIAFDIEEIGALGMAFWLSALAYGAGVVSVWDAGSHPDHDWQELRQEMEKTNVMLNGLGYGADRILWLQEDNLGTLAESKPQAGIPAAKFSGLADKRHAISLALAHLHMHAATPVEQLALSEYAAFGEVMVDPSTCTLCHACVNVCPAGALQDGREQPQLNFIEDLCLQCGLCEQACPEQAINLNPRYLFDRKLARQSRLLHEEPTFHCIVCGAAFATEKMIDIMMEKLKHHPMFQGEAMARIKMCQDCRVKSMFSEKETLS